VPAAACRSQTRASSGACRPQALFFEDQVSPKRYGHIAGKSLVPTEEMEIIGRAFDVPQRANMLEGGRTPILKPPELEPLGFRIVICGISLLMRITRVMQEALADIASGELRQFGTGVSFEEYKRVVGFPGWAALEDRYPKAGP
jgi:2-methylisocitrate lyase-like PEP mutase family enzyme